MADFIQFIPQSFISCHGLRIFTIAACKQINPDCIENVFETNKPLRENAQNTANENAYALRIYTLILILFAGINSFAQWKSSYVFPALPRERVWHQM